MKGLVLLVLGLALIGAGVFLVHRARAMTRIVDRQLNGVPDFTDRTKMFGFGGGMIALGFLSIYGAYAEWFTP